MPRQKLQRFAEMKSLPNVFEPDNPHHPQGWAEVDVKGKWRSEVFPMMYDIGLAREAEFPTTAPLVVELGCGRGDYVMALAERFPDQNFVGVDVKGARLWAGAKEALEKKFTNVAFLRMRIEELGDHFAEEEVDEIWITFADPFSGKRRASRRLTSPRFVGMYKRLLKKGGRLHLKHDNEAFFDYSLEMLSEGGFVVEREIRDVYEDEDLLLTEIQTTYEKRHLKDGRKIFYAEVSVGV